MGKVTPYVVDARLDHETSVACVLSVYMVKTRSHFNFCAEQPFFLHSLRCVRQKVEKFEHDVGEHDNISNCYREHIVVSVAASDLDRARDFARRHKIPRAYGNYEDLAKDPEVQVAYVGVIAPAHLNVVTTLLKAGK